MKNIKRICFFAFTLLMILQFNSFVTPKQSTAYAASGTYVCKTATRLYEKPDNTSRKKGYIKVGKKVTVTGSSGNFYMVTVKYTDSNKTVKGYCWKSKFDKVKSKKTGKNVITYAKKFLGNPYVYGGTSLTHGTDCSGFTMGVYKHFGVSLPHSSYSQRSYGKSVSSLSAAKAGDILCFNGHVGLYMGNGKMIHAANPSSGICITSSIRNLVTIRRIFS